MATTPAMEGADGPLPPPHLPLTCGSWIPVLRPHLSEALVGDTALARLRAVARYLPGDCLGVIEIRLAAGAPGRDGEAVGTVDLSLRLTEPSPARRWVDHLTPAYLKRFLRHGWKEIGHPAPVSSLWLEFDLDHDPPELPAPVVAARLRERVDPGWLADRLLPALHGRSLYPAQRRCVLHSVDQLPADLRLLYAFSLQSRPGAAVRLEFFGHDLQAMLDYLGKMVPRETARRVADLAPLLHDTDRYHLSFDVGTSIGPRIGLECGFVRLPHREPRWLALFDRLVAAGLASAEKLDAVFAWPGYDTCRTALGVWPEEEWALDLFCVRCLSHVKIVSRPDREPEAKAYLLFQPLESKRQRGEGGSGTGRSSSVASSRACST